MSESKKIIKQNLDNITDEELISEFPNYINIEFSIKTCKYVFRNITDEFLKDFNRASFIKILTFEIEWYNYMTYDTLEVLGERFTITETSKNKCVLIRSN
jgi:hypothetical protein